MYREDPRRNSAEFGQQLRLMQIGNLSNSQLPIVDFISLIGCWYSCSSLSRPQSVGEVCV